MRAAPAYLLLLFFLLPPQAARAQTFPLGLHSSVPSTAWAGPESNSIHPGILHTREDLDRIKASVASGAQPYSSGWSRLTRDSHASLDYVPRPFATVTRTLGGAGTGHAEMVNDAIAASLHATAWYVTGNAAHARKAAEILDAWSSALEAITGDGDRYLAAGLTAYHFANAAEILRATYPAWPSAGIERLRGMLLGIFYPLCHDFLVRHNGSRVDHYFANWDAANMLSILAIGVFADDRAKFQEAVDYFKSGPGNGCIMRAVWDGETGQLQESGRDQPHAQLSIGLLATLCEIAWNQGVDLYGYADNRLLKGFEYTAKYLLGHEVPFKRYSDSSRTFTVIAPRGTERRPIYEMVWNHYVNRRNVPAPFTRQMAETLRPEGFHRDHPGFGTVLFTRPSHSAAIPGGGVTETALGPAGRFFRAGPEIRVLRVAGLSLGVAPAGAALALDILDPRGISRQRAGVREGAFLRVEVGDLAPGMYLVRTRGASRREVNGN